MEGIDTQVVARSYEAAHLEFSKEPMDDYYGHRFLGALSRLRVRTIIRELADVAGKKVLEVGCEAGFVSLQLGKAGAEVYSFDIVKAALSRFGQKIVAAGHGQRRPPQLFMASAHHIPVTEGIFDCVVCTEVIEHIPYPERVISEIARVLKPGGIFVLTFPNERIRKIAYPIVKLLGIDTSVEEQVTLFSYHLGQLLPMLSRHLTVVRSYTIPPMVPFTYVCICSKRAGGATGNA